MIKVIRDERDPAMNFSLFLIDLQLDFIEAEQDAAYQPALPVAGSLADVHRIAGFIRQATSRLEAVGATFDSHPAYGIERPGFWRYADGKLVPAHTNISVEDIDTGRVALVNPEHALALDTVRQMAAQGDYQLRVWPRHAVEGSIGAAMHPAVMDALSDWEVEHHAGVFKVFKGRNPFTEHFGAVRAAVQLDEHTRTNEALLDWLKAALARGAMFVAGEAGSHCVPSTMRDVILELAPELVRNIVLLTDGMSPVPGFEDMQRDFLRWSAERGARLMTVAQATALVHAG